MAADGIIEKRRVDLVVEVLARRFLDVQSLAIGAVAFEVVIPLLQDKTNKSLPAEMFTIISLVSETASPLPSPKPFPLKLVPSP